MQRSKRLVFDDVEKAFMELVEAKVVPTVQSVRSILKRGSNTTILKLLNKAKEKHNYVPPNAETDIWEKALAEATAIFTDERAIWEKEKQDILIKIEELEKQRTSQREAMELLKSELKAQEAAFKRLISSLHGD